MERITGRKMTENFLLGKNLWKKIEKHFSKLKKVLFKVLFIQSLVRTAFVIQMWRGRGRKQYSEDLGPVRIFSYNCGKKKGH